MLISWNTSATRMILFYSNFSARSAPSSLNRFYSSSAILSFRTSSAKRFLAPLAFNRTVNRLMRRTLLHKSNNSSQSQMEEACSNQEHDSIKVQTRLHKRHLCDQKTPSSRFFGTNHFTRRFLFTGKNATKLNDALSKLNVFRKSEHLTQKFFFTESTTKPNKGIDNTFPREFVLRLDDTKKPLQVSIKGPSKPYALLREILKYGFTVLLTVAALSLVIENAATNISKGLNFGSSYKVNVVNDTNTCFNDVKGCDEVKAEVEEIVSYLTDPSKFTRLGAKLPRGILLCGPPGTGKTLLARAIAGEAKVPFIQCSGSEFEEMFVGIGARRIRELFAQARRLSPAIVFIDEIDAVGSKRVNKENTSIRMTLNQLLTELDGFEQSDGVVVLCATNFPECLDSALTRPGRLDKKVIVPLPDLQGRKEILDLYGSRVVLDSSVDLSILARRTAGMTGADLHNIINIAAVKSSVESQPSITMEALESAFDRVVVGLERRNPMSEEERQMTAIHEAGHALVSIYNKLADPVHKVTIMPRGDALGITWQIPKNDRYQEKMCELEARLSVLMGGKAAEVLVYGLNNTTAGCTADLKTATNIARKMVMQFGMAVPSTHVPMFIDETLFLAESTRQKVDNSIQHLLNTAYDRAYSLLSAHQEQLQTIAKALVEFETITFDELHLIVDGRIKEVFAKRQNQQPNQTSQQQEPTAKPNLPAARTEKKP